jgi:hypothetical protein
MEEEKPKKKRKKKAAEDGEPKEHRKSWREDYATVEDIKTFLGGRLYLRHNVVTGRVECKIPEADTFSGSRLAAADWQPVNDRIVNSLSAVYLGRALGELGFQRVKYNGVRGYIVVCRSGDEMHAAQQSMAMQAEKESGSVDSSGQYF